MRILANYGYRSNGDSYSVTFETMGDVAQDQAAHTVDTLFGLAREAVKRQLHGATEQPMTPTAVTVPRLPAGRQVPEVQQAHGNGKSRSNGKHVAIKDPLQPASPKQIQLLMRLAKERGAWIENLDELNKGEASLKIEELMAH